MSSLKSKCAELADELGFLRHEVHKVFSEVALMLEYERKLPRPIAQISALEITRLVFDKRGRKAN